MGDARGPTAEGKQDRDTRFTANASRCGTTASDVDAVRGTATAHTEHGQNQSGRSYSRHIWRDAAGLPQAEHYGRYNARAMPAARSWTEVLSARS